MKIARMYDVKLPSRGTEKSAGLDFYIPERTNAFIKDFQEKNPSTDPVQCQLTPDSIWISPHGKVMIPLGIKVEVPKNRALIAFNKTGVSWLNTVDGLSAVIDEDYQGMLFLTLVNYSAIPSYLHYGQKVIQLLTVPIEYTSVEEVLPSEIHQQPTKRGDGALGSTGKF